MGRGTPTNNVITGLPSSSGTHFNKQSLERKWYRKPILYWGWPEAQGDTLCFQDLWRNDDENFFTQKSKSGSATSQENAVFKDFCEFRIYAAFV